MVPLVLEILSTSHFHARGFGFPHGLVPSGLNGVVMVVFVVPWSRICRDLSDFAGQV